MAFFLSTYTNKVDKKGRVSVPASFRSAISKASATASSSVDANNSAATLVLFTPTNFRCIEGSDAAFLEQLSDNLYGEFGPFDEEQTAVATAFLGGARELTSDPEGRVMLPPAMREAAGIGQQATFVGLGRKFQIWDSVAYEAHQCEQLKLAAKATPNLSPFNKGGNNG
ncbi:MAG: hypothetical protein KUG56_09885 [Kordiimonadaceae bacterium]|nr:hypothetical protein [Kordiimonadaceae bacterium]